MTTNRFSETNQIYLRGESMYTINQQIKNIETNETWLNINLQSNILDETLDFTSFKWDTKNTFYVSFKNQRGFLSAFGPESF